MNCSQCGNTFVLEEARRGFDHYFSESAKWNYDELFTGQDLCWDCADTEASTRWMNGLLEAADGPPPADEQAIWDRMEK